MGESDAFHREMESLDWQHSINLGNGVVTPGRWGGGNSEIMAALDDCVFDGARVLDVGTLDGLYAFECEKRGADVFATDWVCPGWGKRDTFLFAHKALNSKVRYFPDTSVYRLEDLGVAEFDVVIFCGVYYHLRDPLLAFARLRNIMKTSAKLIVEGAVFPGSACHANFYYRNHLANDRSNWWVPTTTCLHEWVESSFFDITKIYSPELASGRTVPVADSPITRLVRRLRRRPAVDQDSELCRHTLLATAVMRNDENYAYPYEDLARFSPRHESSWNVLTAEEGGNRISRHA